MLKEFLNLCSTQEKTGVTKLKNFGISTKSVDTSIMCLLILISTTSQFSDIRKTIILMNSESRSLIFEECYYKISLPNFVQPAGWLLCMAIEILWGLCIVVICAFNCNSLQVVVGGL